MTNYYINLVLFRILLPLMIAIAVLLRPCGLSGVYLLFFFISPFIPTPTTLTIHGKTGCFLKVFLISTMLTALSQIAFQIVLLALPPYGHFLKDCEYLESILRHVGFIRYDGLSATTVTVWIFPEFLMCFGSVFLYTMCNRFSRPIDINLTEAGGTELNRNSEMNKHSSHTTNRPIGFLVSLGKYATLILLCIASVLRPSVQAGFYFLIFLMSATWWACCKKLEKGFAIVLRIVMSVIFVHFSILYAYQTQWPQEILDANSTYARYFGLTPIITVDCSDEVRHFTWTIAEWATYANPVVLLVLYYTLAIQSNLLLNPQRAIQESSYHPGETTPLIRGVSSSSHRYGSAKSNPDSTGSVTVGGDEIPMKELGAAEEEYEPSCFETLMFAMEKIVTLIIRSSYVGTNIIMMTWSITYLSWITFVLLIWANLLWLVPNQRKSMLRSSPFLVFYAWFLLISAYIYSMNLTDEELPSVVQGFNLAQIGFVKIKELPCNPLMVKCLFTATFWITMRQYVQEMQNERQTNAIVDMAAPLHVTVGTATTFTSDHVEQNTSSKLNNFGDMLLQFLTKFWIWGVAITLFIVAITGQRMTVFRILYMALFLFFVLTFQLSFHFWRKMMFAFWSTVIIYSMIMLVMVYTYQFDDFPKYWSDYLHVPEQQQLDIGLETFETKQLFVRLVTPTFFVIITVIQLHYFHKNFLELSDPRNASPIGRDLDESSLQGGITTTSTSPPNELLNTATDSSLITSSHRLEYVFKWAHTVQNLVYLFLELHMPKIVLFFLMLVLIYDKCAIYLILAFLLLLALTFGRGMQMFTIYSSSMVVSLMLLARMIYQIDYIDPSKWNVTCVNENETEIENNAKWFGFYKTNDASELSHLVRWNIIYILVVTLMSVVFVRQFNYRASRGRPTTRAFFMFPKITRLDAERGCWYCIKFLFNFCFYKFGVEFSLMATMALIGIRMDMYALMYAIWLCVLFRLKRKLLAKIWPFYLIFIAFFFGFQYCMAVGLPPSLCQIFPWDKGWYEPTSDLNISENFWHRFCIWAYLLDNEKPQVTTKLICDFILLLFVSRQSLVFRIEKRHENDDYPGGSNDSIIHHADEPRFVNPYHDFITHVCSYYDVIKRGFMMSNFWISLAVVFLAGTNRVNLFSVGYLCCAFGFLWLGSDLYLRPLPSILKLWNGLIMYNVIVVLIKTSLQFVGCVAIDFISSDSCWLIQLFGVGCIDKFDQYDLIDSGPVLDTEDCKILKESVGLVWDGLCFGFLMVQRRIFQSYNFFHMVNEIKASTILASRGAELIEDLRLKRMNEQEEIEKAILEKIKTKMDRIKANQQRIQAGVENPKSHYIVPELVHSSSLSSQSAGYHTPIDDDEENDDYQHIPLTPQSSFLHHPSHLKHRGTTSIGGAPSSSPYSAVTVSLDGYLEPQRISFSSPPNSDLNRAPSDDSFPVFSPPPYDDGTNADADDNDDDEAPSYHEVIEQKNEEVQNGSIGPPWMPSGSCITPRQSVYSYSSRSPLSHHEYTIFKGPRCRRRKQPVTYKQAVRSGDYYMFEDLDDDEDELDEMAALEQLTHEKDYDDDPSQMTEQTVTQLLSNVLKSDIHTSLRQQSHPEDKRRMSMPLSRQRSSGGRSQISIPFSAPPTIQEHPEHTVTIVEAEPQPGTSKEDDYSNASTTEEQELTSKKRKERFLNYFRFVGAFFEGILVSFTNILNRYTKDYRYVIRVLHKEKQELKETTDYSTGIRLGSAQVWQPAASYHSLLKQSRITLLQSVDGNLNDDSSSDTKGLATNDESRRKASVLTIPEIRILAASLERGLDSPSLSPQNKSEVNEYEATELSSHDQPVIMRLLLALWYTILCQSELLCYFIIFLNQIKSATFLSLPLPFMVFFWATMTIPRPDKNFWVTIIAYTEVIVLIKCVFQFELIPWNTNIVSNNPFYPPRIIGIEKQDGYAVWDLLLLLVVFFHRFMLKSMGLWNTLTIQTAMLDEGVFNVTASGQMIKTDYSGDRLNQSGSQGQALEAETLAERSSDLQRLVEDDSFDDMERRYVSIDSKSITAKTNLIIRLRLVSRYAEGFKRFLKQLRDPTSRVAADVYSYMFLCDFFNFFVILIGYSAFGTQQGDVGGVSSYLEDNRVPVLFLVMLIIQFMLIIIDRGIFLRKNIFAKIIFQFVQILTLHIWLFIVFPKMTDRSFNSVLPPQMYYMVKCFYLLLSAYQIRCGYPTRILGNFLCKGYNYANMFLFKGFMLIPFLFELRTIMDWMWTDTSMTVFDWIKMEDIFAHIFQLKCTRHCENEYPQPRGERKKPIVKYLMGGFLLALIIAIIWFPLVFFSLGNAVGTSNPPTEVTLEIRIGPYEPVYMITAQNNSIYRFNDHNYHKLLQLYGQQRNAINFISNYDAGDVAAVKLSSDSANIWSISPPDRSRMTEEVNSTQPLTIRLEYKVTRDTGKKEDSTTIRDTIEIILPPTKPYETQSPRMNLMQMLNGNLTVSPVFINNILPKFLKVTNRGTATPVSELFPNLMDESSVASRSVYLRMNASNYTTASKKEWWSIKEDCNDKYYNMTLKKLPYNDCNSIILYTFNEKIFPTTLSILTGGGIVGLYTTIVFVASRFLRGFFADQCIKIMFEDMPNVDRIIQLCLDIYLVREAREFLLEEDLFAKLVFLFRSPETLIKWTRPKEENDDEEEEEEEENENEEN